MCRAQTTAASKLSPMGSRSGTVPNGPWMPPSSAQSREQARCRLGLTPGQAKRRQTYPELVRARRCRLVVAGVEVGGRFSTEAATWLRLLARHRASAAPAAMQSAARSAWVARWSGLLAVAAHSAFAASLLELPLAGECNVGREAPELHEVLADVRWQLPVPARSASRLGPC